MKTLCLIIPLVLCIPTNLAAQAERRPDCRELKRACDMKQQLGEQGEGNCRRYRENCERRMGNCERLRMACMFKSELGERGEGNCRQYRENCRGR
jgi:hypothetical protein